MSLNLIDETELQFNDAASVVWVRVQDAAGLLWKDNPKRHDIGAIIESIKRYGFQERPKLDVNLPNVSDGKGAIVAGNGRIEALAGMERDDRYELPRGLAQDRDGAWCMPILVGTDASSPELASAYAIDDNNLVLAGGDMDSGDYIRMYSSGYVPLLRTLAEYDVLPVTVESDALLGPLTGPAIDSQMSIICLSVARETRDRFFVVLGQMGGETESQRVDSMLDVASLNT